MEIMDYVKPELLVLALVLYFIGMWIKKSETIKDKYIPLILGLIGIVLCIVWVIGTTSITSWQTAAMGIFTGVVQGVLVAGLSTYTNQILKQKNNDE